MPGRGMPPARLRTGGHARLAWFEISERLFPIVHVHAVELFAVRLSSMHVDGARLSVGRDDDLASHGDFSFFLNGDVQSAFVYLRVGPHVGSRVACDWVELSVKLAYPLVMGGFALRIRTVHRDFDSVADGLVDNGTVLAHSR